MNILKKSNIKHFITTLLLIGGLILSANTALAYQPNQPTIFAPVGGITLSSSYNWSGYTASGGSYTAVGASWIVPQVSVGGNIGGDATWVGIGGIANRNLLQAGTQAITDSRGSVSYQAWYELLPGYSQTVPLKVNPGDSVTAAINQRSGNQWNITITDNTTGQNYNKIVTYNSSLSSAEWIEEMPLTNIGFIGLDNFGSINFTDAWTIKDGVKVELAQAGALPVTMMNYARQAIATPGLINSDNSFTITRTSAASSPVVAYVFGGRGRSFSNSGRSGRTAYRSGLSRQFGSNRLNMESYSD